MFSSRFLVSASIAVLCLATVSTPSCVSADPLSHTRRSSSHRHVSRHVREQELRAVEQQIELYDALESVKSLEARVNRLIAEVNPERSFEPIESDLAGADSAEFSEGITLPHFKWPQIDLKKWYDACRNKDGLNRCAISAGATAGLACAVAGVATAGVACAGAAGTFGVAAATCIATNCI